MKGQISFVEFLVALLIFAIFVGYFSFRLLTYVPYYLNELKKERANSEAYQISEILVNDVGNPANWDDLPFDQVKSLGLSDESINKTNVLSFSKIDKLNSQCQADYASVKNLLQTDYDFSIYILNSETGVMLMSCQPSELIARNLNITVRRMISFNSGDYGELLLQVW